MARKANRPAPPSWPPAPNEGPPAHVPAREAVELLGIQLRTLYAYASRGLVRSIQGARHNQRLYLRADLEKLKGRHDARAGHAAVAVDALRWGEPVLDSAITRIDRDGARYRGHAATALAAGDVPFEAVSELLWRGELPVGTAPRWRVSSLGFPAEKLAVALSESDEDPSPLLKVAIVLPALAIRDSSRSDTTPEAECSSARKLLVRLRAALALESSTRRRAALEAKSTAQGFLEAFGGGGDPEADRIVNRALVLCADHELNVSAFAARLAASAECDLYACFSAAVAVLSGRRHGGATELVEALVREVGSADRARRVVGERTRRGEIVPGFGHRLYPDSDPRAEHLLELARERGQGGSGAGVLFAIVDAMRALGREPPTLDVGLVATGLALGLPRRAPAALFAMGRMAGWVAHVLEQRKDGHLLRPRARYVGV
jgi:citrate synthase